MSREEKSWKSSPFTDKAFDISIEVNNREDLPIREKWRSTSNVTELAHRFFFSLFSLIAGECLKDNNTNDIENGFSNISSTLFKNFNLDNLDEKGSLEKSINRYIEKLERYRFYLPNDFVELIKDKSRVKPRSEEFDIGYKGDLDSVVDCFREVLKSLRDEKIIFWKNVFKKYKEDKEAFDLDFRTKQTRRRSDLDKFSKINIKEYVDKLGSIGKKKS